jgi:hypothetical protein
MAESGRGKAIFDQRIEYPLPVVPGVRDYVFHFVPSGDGYGKGARRFLGAFYPRHARHDVSSLEALVDVLHADLTGGVSKIREVVVVAHGNSEVLQVPLLKNTSGPGLGQYRLLGAVTLASLQRDFRAGRFPTFRRRRERVVQALQVDSWVTVRACRFGISADGMYALFAFFGGRANLYAAREYMFFGTMPVMPGMRLETKLEVHEHLVKQRLQPPDLHTPERKDAVVQALVDPGRFSQPFELASARLDQPGSQESVQYQRLVDALNAQRISDLVRARFAAAGRELSLHPRVRRIGGERRVQVTVRDVRWRVLDSVRHEGKAFTVEYDVAEEIVDGPGGQRASLRAAAKVADAFGARDSFPVQLFFFEGENNLWRGKLPVLASYTEEGGVPTDRPRFEALRAVLPSTNAAVPAPALLRSAFKDALGVELDTATVRLVERTGDGPLARITWLVEHGEQHKVKLEHFASEHGVRGHSLSVYTGLSDQQRVLERFALMAHLGRDPDAPGTELAAYFDRFTIEELVDLIDVLRSPYRAGHAYYIHHAQHAIKRKKDYLQWTTARTDHDDPLGPLLDPYEVLSGGEAEDKRHLAYDFDFNLFWQEVRASHPSIGAFQTDLFVEEDLQDKLDLPDQIAGLTFEPESPFSDVDEARQLEAAGREEFFALAEKSAFEPGPRDQGLSCPEFTAVLERWKELQGQPSAEIKRLLDLESTSDGKTFLDHVEALYDAYQLYDLGDDLLDMATLEDGLAVKLVERIPAFAPSLIGVPTTLTIMMRVWPVFSIPYDLWMRTAEAEERADQFSENLGRVTAARQWLRELTRRASGENLPDDFEIDLSMFGEEHPFIARYVLEQRQSLDEEVIAFAYDQDRGRAGFDEGVRLMKRANKEILERADEAVAAILRQPGLDACKVKALHDAGVVDLQRIRAAVIIKIADGLLDLLPRL